MARSDSPLRDRVVFVEGVPRSGTTLLAALLAGHPEIAGIASESHVFDRGIGTLYDNWEGAHGWRPHLAAFIARDELADLARELADGVLETMRAQTRADASFVVEKTPTGPRDAALTLERKLEVYPDAFYVHVVRDRDEVTRSLAGLPWNRDRSAGELERWWGEGVKAVRTVLGELPRYRELGYEELVADPAGAMGRVYEWLGLEAGPDVRERVEQLARERYAAGGRDDDEGGDGAETPRGGRRRRSGTLARLRGAVRDRRPVAVANAFADALRSSDADAMKEVVTPGVALFLSSGEGDLRAVGDEARSALVAVGREVFGDRRFLSESWSVDAGRDFAVAHFAGALHDGRRVDLACTLAISRGRVTRAGLQFAGPIAGREPRDWIPGA